MPYPEGFWAWLLEQQINELYEQLAALKAAL